MAKKHYSVGYLEDTFNAMSDIKNYSYLHFQEVEDGTILDLGCGMGKDVINMATSSDRKTNFIGIDHDAIMIEQANAQKNNIPNVTFMEGEIFPLPFKNNSISGVRAERLFQHLQQPDKVLEEISRVLKPEHPFMIVETDWDSISFYNADILTEKKIRAYLTESKVVNGKIAKQLTHALIRQKFRKIKFDIFPLIFHSFKDACTYFWIDKIADEMMSKNLLNALEHNSLMDSLKNADKGGYFACSINMVTSFCVK